MRAVRQHLPKLGEKVLRGPSGWYSTAPMTSLLSDTSGRGSWGRPTPGQTKTSRHSKPMAEDFLGAIVLQMVGEREGGWAEEFQKATGTLNVPPLLSGPTMPHRKGVQDGILEGKSKLNQPWITCPPEKPWVPSPVWSCTGREDNRERMQGTSEGRVGPVSKHPFWLGMQLHVRERHTVCFQPAWVVLPALEFRERRQQGAKVKERSSEQKSQDEPRIMECSQASRICTPEMSSHVPAPRPWG